MQLRDYQSRCIESARAAFRRERSVCIVAPTGAGKTVLGLEVVRRTLAARGSSRALWIAHRNELIQQARERAEAFLGPLADRMSVATVQGLAASGERPRADLVVLDEAHHYAPGAAQWHDVIDHYSAAWRLGLTATPQRGDGSPLGDVFGELVVAAQYSELVESGHLVSCDVLRPDRQLKSTELASDPVAMWQEHAAGRSGFLFGGRVDECQEFSRRLTAAGIPAETIHGNTPTEERDLFLHEFRSGHLKVLCSVYVLTEGVDVPAAEVCMLARGCQHAGTYLQMVGRVLRPSPGKAGALLVDLTGVSWSHGFPTDDRVYALEGRAIRTTGQQREAEEQEERAAEDRQITIYSMDLQRVYAGEATPASAKAAEWERLKGVCRSRGWGLSWAAKEYRKLFSSPPPATMEDKAETMRGLRARCAEKGYKKGWAAHQYRQAFGVWPRGV